ncbi:pectin esterase [Pedobacter sp. HMF7647]|uniref:Pectinesterase n=1 Tax=Hufsiella arboris TaxID=2695275 RepID=A0A7K1Y4J0_9SPHI|nr:pectinesterase family protein [Hufsiella arboris]MXV49492.1 pectin esterase [Hufsiella arboris]
MKILPAILIYILFFSGTVFSQTSYNFPAKYTVAQDGSGDFKTIQEAVNAVRDLAQVQVTIFLKNGIYHEKLVIPSWKTHISLVGEDKEKTVITNNDFSGKKYENGKDPYGKDLISTYTSYTVLVQGNDFIAENLTIENTAGRVGQAVALHVEGDRSIIKNCRLLSNQDTLYTATGNSRQYYLNCYIEGTTDFIFGEATAVFQYCTIKSLINSYITAAATTPSQKFGYVFFDCNLIADTSAHKVFLGRPWRPNAKTVFIRCDNGQHIQPEGWDNWRDPENEKTVFYAEYQSKGAGVALANRVKWSKQLKKRDIAAYTLPAIFSGWNPR